MRYTSAVVAAVLLAALPGQAQVTNGGGAGAGIQGVGAPVPGAIPGVGAPNPGGPSVPGTPGVIPGVGAPTGVGGGPTVSANPETGAVPGPDVTTPAVGPNAGATVPGGGTGAVGGGTIGPITTGIRPGATYGIVSAAPAGTDTAANPNQINVPGTSNAISPQGFQGSPSGTFQNPGLAEAVSGVSAPFGTGSTAGTTNTTGTGGVLFTGGIYGTPAMGYGTPSGGYGMGGGGGAQNNPAALGSPYTPATSTPSVYGTMAPPGLYPPTAPGTSGRFQLPATVVTVDGTNGTFTISPYAISPLGTLRNPNPQ